MAEGVMSSASMLWPDLTQVGYLSLQPDTNPDDFQNELLKKIKENDTGEGVYVLADIMGGTPCNRALMLLGAGENVRVLSGLSLTMLISLLNARDFESDPDKITSTVLEETSAGTLYVNDLMK
jgi:mannose/fructose-specific phosphotransferase system component IIA